MLRRLAHLRYRRELLRRKCSSEFFGSCLALPVTPNTKIPGPDPTKKSEAVPRGNGVYVHCNGGRGRSVVCVLCYLVSASAESVRKRSLGF